MPERRAPRPFGFGWAMRALVMRRQNIPDYFTPSSPKLQQKANALGPSNSRPAPRDSCPLTTSAKTPAPPTGCAQAALAIPQSAPDPPSVIPRAKQAALRPSRGPRKPALAFPQTHSTPPAAIPRAMQATFQPPCGLHPNQPSPSCRPRSSRPSTIPHSASKPAFGHLASRTSQSG